MKFFHLASLFGCWLVVFLCDKMVNWLCVQVCLEFGVSLKPEAFGSKNSKTLCGQEEYLENDGEVLDRFEVNKEQ